jgi:transcriptional regulator with XRE-family HTH domain
LLRHLVTVATSLCAVECVTLTGMDEPDRQRLADALNQRRGDLGLSQPEIARQAEVSLSTVNLMATGKRNNYRLIQKRRVEDVLRWAPGSIDALLAGGDATPLPESVKETRRDDRAADLPLALAEALAAVPEANRDLFVRLSLRIADELAAVHKPVDGTSNGHTHVTVPVDDGVSQAVVLHAMNVTSAQLEADAAALRERLRVLTEQAAKSNQ